MHDYHIFILIMTELQCFIFTSLISADNDEFTEAQKQRMLARYNRSDKEHDWEYILAPIKESEHYDTYLHILNR
jgi:hypothetical protein